MAEVFVTFTEAVPGPDGVSYLARACGGEMDDGRWQGWLEFEATDGSGIYRSRRETTQPNRTDLAYWATGLTAVYLEGAIERTLRPGPVVVKSVPPVASTFDEPLPPARPDEIPATEAVLNPFSVVRKGEAHLRQQLGALAAWHLVNIVRAYELSPLSSDALNLMTPADLIELIVAPVRQDTPVSR